MDRQGERGRPTMDETSYGEVTVLETNFDSTTAFAAANSALAGDLGTAAPAGVEVSFQLDADQEVYLDIAGTQGAVDRTTRPIGVAAGHGGGGASRSAEGNGMEGPRRSNNRRSMKRQAQAIARKSINGPYVARLHQPKQSSQKYHSRLARISTRLDTRTLPHANGGAWIGSRADPLHEKPWTLDEALNTLGFRLIKYTPGRSVVFTDKADRIVGGLLDKPAAPDWDDVLSEAGRALRAARSVGVGNGTFSTQDFQDRRGNFLKIPVGISTGGGQKRPGNLFHHIKARRTIARSILRNKAIQRIAGVQSTGFAFLNPKLYSKYCDVIGALHDHDRNLETNFINSIFPAASFNCGPQSVSLDHFDFNNLSYGFCGLTPAGNFDHTKGGHLILFELKLVLEFPTGTTALIPSAAVRHANTAIQPGEERMSIAQYAAGGIFRWVAYGFKSGKSLNTTATGRRKRSEANGDGGARWCEGLDLYSTPDTLAKDQQLLF